MTHLKLHLCVNSVALIIHIYSLREFIIHVVQPTVVLIYFSFFTNIRQNVTIVDRFQQ